MAPASKTYAPGGTSVRQKAKAVFSARGPRRTGDIPMLDILMLTLALGFFVAGIGYAYACERL
jgi:hypothetical protein